MEENKGKVCVTGGTGHIASWLIMRLLENGFAVNTTVRSNPENKKDVSFLTSLPGATQNLQIFKADLSNPESFDAAIQGCVGVFHVAATIDLEGKELEEIVTKTSINATLGILRACLNSKTVKRVVYTSSAAAVAFSEQNGIDIVTILPSFVVGPFICPKLAGSVHAALAMAFGNKDLYRHPFHAVHVEDLARAYLFLFEHSNPKGRYICSSE
ncbi:Dihydroflavonol 4-reductase-like protein [Quillaja saponaria]|uniref:Dihydroflavonol 4-reductase-like protein n=1 Tax=Quillaja saponaria TaxID=32244 RepID=A0AAD7LRL2_QUISA|nr:Dihydroflavonol 4-reductase-like protein [Quillaja saponaria]